MSGPTALEQEYTPQSQAMWNTYQTGLAQNQQDYGNIMGGYQNFASNLGKPTQFNYQDVSAERPAELGESYGYLREAVPGYREFAQTGGYSPTDIQELRARGVSPIRSAYSNTMMELNRARALGGAGGAPNYIAAASRAQREMPGQMADAMTGVNAQLADAIRQGKLAGLSGISGIGSTMGGLSSQEAGRMLQAAMANQNADLQAQQLSEQSLQNLRQNQLASLSGQTSLYGTTPAMASTFGDQALRAYQNRTNMEQIRNQYGLGLLNAQIGAYGGQSQQDPWWKQLLQGASSVLPYVMPNSNAGPQGSQGQQGPIGSNTPNSMGGNQFTGYMPSYPTAPTGNVSSAYSFPGYPGSGGFGGGYDDWGGWGQGPNDWGGSSWDNGWPGGFSYQGYQSLPTSPTGNYSESGGYVGDWSGW